MMLIQKREGCLKGRELNEPNPQYRVWGVRPPEDVLDSTRFLIWKDNNFQWVKASDYEPAPD